MLHNSLVSALLKRWGRITSYVLGGVCLALGAVAGNVLWVCVGAVLMINGAALRFQAIMIARPAPNVLNLSELEPVQGETRLAPVNAAVAAKLRAFGL